MTDAGRQVLIDALGEAFLQTLQGGQSQISYQMSLAIRRLPPEEWNWILSTVIGKLEDGGVVITAVPVADDDHV